jgi:hypothetical protein
MGSDPDSEEERVRTRPQDVGKAAGRSYEPHSVFKQMTSLEQVESQEF